MFVTCEKCQAQYRLNEAVLGGQGHKVRCTACQHIWFEKGTPQNTQKAQNQATQDDDLLAQIEAMQEKLSTPEPSFSDILKETSDTALPDAINPAIAQELPPLEVKPHGFSANMFGGMAFLFLLFLTCLVLFMARNVVMNNIPSTAHVYETLGFAVRPPGAGLQFSAASATLLIGKDNKKILNIKAKLSNITTHDVHLPAYQLTLTDHEEKPLEQWQEEPEHHMMASSGHTNIHIERKDIPDHAEKVILSLRH